MRTAKRLVQELPSRSSQTCYYLSVERIVHKSRSFGDADRWDVQQQMSMTPQERMLAARELRFRIYPENPPDVRQCHQKTNIKSKPDTSLPT